QLPRYERVRTAKTPEEQAESLRLCGYATDPEYSIKLCNIISMYQLEKYDEEVETVYKELLEKVNRLQSQVHALQRQQERIPAPTWFVQQFGSADLGGLIADPQFTMEGWRALAVALRAQQKK